MSTDPSIRKLLSPMTERPVALGEPAFEVDRARVLAGMARAAAEREPMRPRFAAYALVAVAAAALLGIGVHVWQGRGVENASLEVAVTSGLATQSNGASRTALVRTVTRVPAAGELETKVASAASVRTEKGLEIELSSETRVSLRELAPAVNRVKLDQGSIRCSVPHDPAAKPFQVVTQTATIVDLGTVFNVSVQPVTLATRVSVEQGEVLIRSASGETHVHAPDSWTSDASAAVPSLSASGASASPLAPSHAAQAPPVKVGHISAKSGPSAAASEPTLALESQLLRRGLAAERQGNGAEAAAAFNELLTRYPSSPLAPDARGALARVQAANHE